MTQQSISLYFLIFSIACSCAQNNYNKEGEREGFWSSYHDNGIIKYKGQFFNGKELGIFKYYDLLGNLAIKLNYIDTGLTSKVTLYYTDGKIKSQGTYLNKKKTSLWVSYNTHGRKINQENYKQGVLNGESIHYYENGMIAEIFNYLNGLKHGPFKILYKSGNLNMTCNYLNDLKHGLAQYYFNDKHIVLESKGDYNMGKKDSIWFFYDEEGALLRQEEYDVSRY